MPNPAFSQPTPLDVLHMVWRQIPLQERLAFLTEMLTPNERRQLLIVGWDTDPEPEAPFAFLYAKGQQVRLPDGVQAEILWRRYTERQIFGPLVEYLVQPQAGEVHWIDEADVLPLEAHL